MVLLIHSGLVESAQLYW